MDFKIPFSVRGKGMNSVFLVPAAVVCAAALSSCCFFEKDVPPPAGTEKWADSIQGSYKGWQPPVKEAEPAVFSEEDVQYEKEPSFAVTSGLPVPSQTGLPEKKAPEESAQSDTFYTTVAGDTLWGIAAKFYGKGYRWRKIYMANLDRIRSPRKLRPGLKIVIPSSPSLKAVSSGNLKDGNAK